jgi:hypothetical protein
MVKPFLLQLSSIGEDEEMAAILDSWLEEVSCGVEEGRECEAVGLMPLPVQSLLHRRECPGAFQTSACAAAHKIFITFHNDVQIVALNFDFDILRLIISLVGFASVNCIPFKKLLHQHSSGNRRAFRAHLSSCAIHEIWEFETDPVSEFRFRAASLDARATCRDHSPPLNSIDTRSTKSHHQQGRCATGIEQYAVASFGTITTTATLPFLSACQPTFEQQPFVYLVRNNSFEIGVDCQDERKITETLTQSTAVTSLQLDLHVFWN